MIDRDIKANGTAVVPRFNNNSRLASKNNNTGTRYSSFNNTIEAKRQGGNMRSLPPPPMANKQNDLSYTPKPMNRFNRNSRPNTRFNNDNRFSNNNRFNSNNRFNNNNNRYNRPNNRFPNNRNTRESCPLCGQNHKTADCKNIRDDSGNVLEMHPTYQTCSKCPPFVKPRLRHPEAVCPYRVGGPLNKNTRN
jgi:hypothetical protein